MFEILKKICKSDDYFTECFFNDISEIEVNAEKNKIKNISYDNSQHLSIRVTFKDGKSGFSSTNNIKNWRDTLNKAVKIARLSKKDKDFKKIVDKQQKSKKIIYKDLKKIKNISEEWLVNKIKELINGETNTQSANLTKKIINTWFYNSYDVNYYEEVPVLSGYVSVEKNKISNWEGEVSTKIFNVSKIRKKADKENKNLQHPTKIKTQKKDVIFHPSSFIRLLEIIVSQMTAEKIQDQESYFKDKINQKISNYNLTIINDGKLNDMLESSSYDGEGTKTKRTKVVEKGIFKNSLYDLYTALKENKESTGNCGGISSRPYIISNNLIINKGEIKKEELLNNAIYVKDIMGLHTINPISGDFSLQIINSYLVDKNNKKIPLKDTMISGNLYELLYKIKGISKERESKSDYILPWIKFKDVQIIG